MRDSSIHTCDIADALTLCGIHVSGAAIGAG